MEGGMVELQNMYVTKNQALHVLKMLCLCLSEI